MSGVPSVGGLSKGSEPIFMRVSEQTTENFERLSRQARTGTSRQPVMIAEPLGHGKAKCTVVDKKNATLVVIPTHIIVEK